MLIRLVNQKMAVLFGPLSCAVLVGLAPMGQVLAQDLVDGDADGVPFSIDECPYSRPGEFVDARGCTTLRDSDEDGIADIFDDCPLSQQGALINPNGCAIDTDRDGIADGLDQCAGTTSSQAPDANGCSALQLARQRSSGSAPEVIVGRPRPSGGRAEVLIDTPRPVSPAPQPVPVTPAPSVERPTPVAPPVSKPAALFSASGRSVEFVAFEALGFAASRPAAVQGVSSNPPTVVPAQSEFERQLTQTARFAQPSAVPVPVPDRPAARPVAVPTPGVSPPAAASAATTTAGSQVLRNVPTGSPSVAAVTLNPRPATVPAIAEPTSKPRVADPAAYSPMARAVANALLGLAPENGR